MRKQFILISIIVLGVILRLFILFQRGSLWFDEAFSVHFASMDLREIWSFLKFENNPPLYFYVLHFWISIFGNSELAVRALSMIFGVAAIPMVYLVGMKLFVPLTPTLSRGERELIENPLSLGEREAESQVIDGRTASLFAAFLTAISTFQVFYATETRMYTMYLFFTLLAIYIYITLEKRRQNNQSAGLQRVFFLLTLSVLIWTHITAWWFVLVFTVYILWKEKFNFKRFYTAHRGFLVIAGLLVIQFLPWAWNFARLKIAAPLSQGYFFYLPPDRNYFLDILETFLVFGEDSAFVVTLLSVVMVILLWFAVRGTNVFSPCPRGRLSGGGSEPPLNPLLEKEGKALRFLLCWLFIPLLVGFAFSNAVPRYFIAVAPALYLLMGIGFANLLTHIKNRLPNRQSYMLHVTWCMFIFALILPGYFSLSKITHHQWDGLAEWIMSYEARVMNQEESCLMPHTSCIIIVNPHSEILPFERYYKGVLPVVGFYPHTNDIGVGVYPRDDADNRDLRIVKTNWISLNTKENVHVLSDVTERYNRVFLITGEIDQTIGRNLVPIWFWENEWQRVSTQEFGRIGVMELVRQ